MLQRIFGEGKGEIFILVFSLGLIAVATWHQQKQEKAETQRLKEKLENPESLVLMTDPRTISTINPQIKITSVKAIKNIIIMNPDGSSQILLNSTNPIFIISAENSLDSISKPPQK